MLLGRTGTIGPVEGFAQGIGMCLDLGYADEIRQTTSRNAARLFGFEKDVAAALAA